MTEHSCDVAIVGAGTAGLSAERAARTNGATTLLVDDKFAGTVCATVGCMPSKLLIAAANAAHAARRADIFGINAERVSVDGRAVMRRVRKERDKFVAGVLASIGDLPHDTCIRSKAWFTGPTQLSLANGDSVRSRAIVIATGAYPMVPQPFQELGDLALTNRTVFELEDLPATLAVIGAGAVGLEIAQAMARLGVKTVLFDQTTTLGGASDSDVQQAVFETIGAEVDLQLGVEVSARRDGDKARLDWTGDRKGSRLFDKVLVATGRPSQLADLALEKSGLDLDEHGVPIFNRETMQCGDAPIFIAGDANGDVPLLHEASDEGAIAGHNAVRYPDVSMAKRSPAFSLTFTDPPLAILGDAPDADSVTGCADYDDQGRARVEAKANGLVRLHASGPDGQLIGAEIFAPGSDHMAHLLAWCIERGETASALLEMPFYHPTLEEGLKPALRAICTAMSIPLPQSRDEGDPPGTWRNDERDGPE